MSDSKAKRAWQSARRLFRWFRIAALVLVLAVAGFLFYWNQAGLPDFVKNAVLAELRARGLEISFAKIRFRWDRGIVAERVSFGRAQLVAGPELTLDELAIGLNVEALLRGQVRVDELNLRNGQLAWHFAGTNQPGTPLVIGKINGQLLLRGPVADLKSFGGEFHGAAFQLQGQWTNVPQTIAHWRAARDTNDAGQATNRLPAAQLDSALRRFANSLTNWQFTGTPQLAVTFRGDGTNLPASQVAVRLNAPQAATPFGRCRNLSLDATLPPAAGGNELRHFTVAFAAEEVDSPWARTTAASGSATWDASWDYSVLSNVTAHLQLERGSSRWGEATNLSASLEIRGGATNLQWRAESLVTRWAAARLAHGEARWQTDATQAIALAAKLDAAWLAAPGAGTSGPALIKLDGAWTDFQHEPRALRAELGMTNLATTWGGAGELIGTVRLNAATDWLASLRATNRVVWEKIQPLEVRWDLRLAEVRAEKLETPRLETAGRWRAPELRLDKLNVAFPEGSLAVAGRLDADSRRLEAAVKADFDLHRLAAWLPATNQAVFRRFAWDRAPQWEAQLAAVLPAWTKPAPAWEREVWPTVAGKLKLELAAGTYWELPVAEARAQLQITNQAVRATGFYLRSGPHQVWADASADLAKSRFEVEARALATPELVRPYVATNVQRGLNMAKFSVPPWLEARVAGDWRRPASIEFDALLRATNLVWREVPIDRLETRAHFASNVLTFTKPMVVRPEGQGQADLVIADFNRQMVHLTNAHGCLEPQAVATAIGPHIVKILSPYKFGQPPQARVEGDIPMHGDAGARVCFEVAGGPFNWWRFNANTITGAVWWIGESLVITNLDARLYDGRLVGDLAIDFTPTNESVLTMNMNVSEMQFAQLMRDISDRTNRVEGKLMGRLVVTRAALENWQSWEGYGNVQLTDGMIWDLPVFGIFSPVLNAISPGLGNSRARQGTATFIITNSVILSEDLLINSAGYNLKYEGTVDFDYRVNARVEAELLRETWVVGPVLSLVLKPLSKMFEYRVTGTLADPQTKPIYIPKVLRPLFSPVKSIKDLFTKEREAGKPESPLPK